MQFKLKTWWKDHGPGEIVEEALEEIHSLLCIGGAEPADSVETLAKEEQPKAAEVTADVQPSGTDSPA